MNGRCDQIELMLFRNGKAYEFTTHMEPNASEEAWTMALARLHDALAKWCDERAASEGGGG